MGVTGLWTVVAPTARPTQLASLNRKRLAVDASIWIYQFLKAVRDKEGNALRNSHVVGFFRRICKLLYFGIKPVFVFDGGAPILKRETLRKRVRRREGRREDAARTAGKLLAVQVARAAEEEDRKRKAEQERSSIIDEELPPDQELVYVDEIGMDQKERQAGRQFRRKDQYHLPDLDVSIENMGAPDDPRIMSQAELEEYARHFHSGEDINLYDFSKIDFESPFFLSLPPGDRYNILNAARLRSRLRMGYSKEQLDGMFPDRMAFSKFQIERVKERNELTQRLMHINGMAEDFLNQGGRIAGEKGKEYVLVKNDGVEGGWALGVVSNKLGTKKEDAIDLEAESDVDVDGNSTDEEDFEDIAIEGLNRIPKSWARKRRDPEFTHSHEDAATEIAKKRKEVYEARKVANEQLVRKEATRDSHPKDSDQLFVAQDENSDADDLFEDVDIPDQDDDNDNLQKAIEMSLQPDIDMDSQQAETDLTRQKETNSKEDEDTLDLQAALAESRQSKYRPKTSGPGKSSKEVKFDGPLPFESLNLGQSLLGKKKSKKVEEDMSGGFDRNLGNDAFRKERPAQPIPSWFGTTPDLKDAKKFDPEDNEDAEIKDGIEEEKLLPIKAKEVIDVDNVDENDNEVIDIGSEDEELANLQENKSENGQKDNEWELPVDAPVEEDPKEAAEKERLANAREERYKLARQIAAENEDQEMTNAVIKSGSRELLNGNNQSETISKDINGELAKDAASHDISGPEEANLDFQEVLDSETDINQTFETVNQDNESNVEWSESDEGSTGSKVEAEEQHLRSPTIESDQDEFENVTMEAESTRQEPVLSNNDYNSAAQYLVADGDEDEPMNDDQAPNDEDLEYLSDSDEELMRQLVIESEEHARFASSLNNKTPAEAARDYENELKQLRNQQKKDRRDADEVTQTMVQECQALLRLFGLPYITAPMEAEAQCAELVHLGLVDGIVTDDSDIFLFGGTRIYKNMFNAAKYVECYLATDLEKEYALDRRKLIRFAHLLGSDYTEGIPGVGPVTALEILTDFTNLEDFKEWCSKVQLGRPQDLENQLTTTFRRKFRNAAQKRLFLPPGFPDIRVDQAYLNPDVDSDPEEFRWGIPDLDKLRHFLMSTIGWNQDRTDEILVPVIRDMNKRDVEGTQANLTRFFSGGVGVGVGSKEGTAPRNRSGKESGRMAKAYTRLRNEAEKKKRVIPAKADGVDNAIDNDNEDGLDLEQEGDEEQGPSPKRKKRRRKD